MRRIIAVLACVIVGAVAHPAFAKDDGDQRYKTCQADMEKFRRDVKPGDGRQIACMQSNVDRLSADCATIVREKIAAEKKWRDKKAAEGKPK